MAQNAKNYFKQSGTGTDNQLVLDGTVSGAGAVSLTGAVKLSALSTAGSNRIDDRVIALSLPVITALAGAAKSIFVAPCAGTIQEIRASVDGAFITSDITITGRINTTAITTGVVTLATAASGFGTKGSATPTALNVVAAGDVVNVTITGGVNAQSGIVQVIFRPS